MDDLPWARPFGRRCRARIEPNKSGYWGRCDLAPHDQAIDHALERGMDTPRWSTRFTDGAILQPPLAKPVRERVYPRQTGGAHPLPVAKPTTGPKTGPSAPSGEVPALPRTPQGPAGQALTRKARP